MKGMIIEHKSDEEKERIQKEDQEKKLEQEKRTLELDKLSAEKWNNRDTSRDKPNYYVSIDKSQFKDDPEGVRKKFKEESFEEDI